MPSIISAERMVKPAEAAGLCQRLSGAEPALPVDWLPSLGQRQGLVAYELSVCMR